MLSTDLQSQFVSHLYLKLWALRAIIVRKHGLILSTIVTVAPSVRGAVMYTNNHLMVLLEKWVEFREEIVFLKWSDRCRDEYFSKIEYSKFCITAFFYVETIL